jgi:hypothetical protein
VGSWFKQPLCAAQRWCFVKELLVKKCVKRLLATYLAIRQRKNSLFYATEHSAYIASVLTSVIATCVQAGVNALEYLVAIQEHRQEVRANPGAWLPWNYQMAFVP